MKSRTTRWPNVYIIAYERQCLIAAGRDPMIIPDEPPGWLSIAEVCARFKWSEATVRARVKEGRFPQGVTVDVASGDLVQP